MATFRKTKDPMVSCPIDPVHRMLSSKLQMHITKCRRENPNADIQTCPFNAQHLVAGHEYSQHLCNCPSRSIVDKQILNCSTAYQGATNVPAYNDNNIGTSPQEFWDEDLTSSVPGPGYDPTKTLASKRIIPDTAHMKPLEKKALYKSMFQSEPRPQPEMVVVPKPNILQPALRKPLNDSETLASLGNRGNRRLAANFSGVQSRASTQSSSPMPVLGRGRGILSFSSSRPESIMD